MQNNQANEQELISQISSGETAHTKLETDDKVLARVTDGIYRFPSSAIRELISNSYDADAENVRVETDMPRFDSITVRDDGNGMSIDTLVNMIRHIGGSAKRNEKGKDLGVTSPNNSRLSLNKNRCLIGKIGIGLFSVAQLTRDFEIITKQKNKDFYLRAKIELFNYSDDLHENASIDKRGESFQTGNVSIWTEPTDNIDAHGTDIIMHNIKTSAKEQLQSVDIWGQTRHETEQDASSLNDHLNSSKANTPNFHIGFLAKESHDGLLSFGDSVHTPKLPWNDNDEPQVRLQKLYDGILDITKNAVSPKLEQILDNYLNMIWTLSLSIPLPYIDKHPFRLTKEEMPDTYAISNSPKGQVQSFIDKLENSNEIGTTLGFISHKNADEFNVIIDGIKLFRPIKFTNLPESKNKIKKPILFLGKYATDFTEEQLVDSGGNLEFEAYCMWCPKISPKDHNGSLVRIHNASGILFDPTFMKHQVAEHTIKSQLTIEIFVTKGLDSALNIDRESFNIAHPHYQILTRWLHSALRQVVNKFKSIKSDIRKHAERENNDKFSSDLRDVVNESLEQNQREVNEVSALEIISKKHEKSDFYRTSPSSDSYILNSDTLNSKIPDIKVDSPKFIKPLKKSEAILQILDAYNLLNNMKPEAQEALVIDILKVLLVEDK